MAHTAVALKRNGKHHHEKDEEFAFKPLKASEIFVGKIPQSNRPLPTPSIKPSVSIALIEAAAEWLASERERLLKERRKRNGKKK